MGQKRKYYPLFGFLIFLLIFSIILNLSKGSANIGLKTLYNGIFGSGEFSQMESNILFKIRMPRIIAAILFGGALSVSGYMLQTFFRNPIVGPFVLGISSGAKLFVSLFMFNAISWTFINENPLGMFLVSFMGSMFAMFFVLLLSKSVKSSAALIIIGIMIGYIASAGTNFMVAFADDRNIANLHNWSLGTFSGATWDMLKVSAFIIIPAVIVVYLISKPLEGYLLGENYAKTMGVNIKVFRVLLIVLSSVLSACVTAFAGPISFVGIAVPHVTKIIGKTANPRILTPAIFLFGASFALIADFFARNLFAPSELNLSTVTSFIGAPIVIYLMVSRRKEKWKTP